MVGGMGQMGRDTHSEADGGEGALGEVEVGRWERRCSSEAQGAWRFPPAL